jgi:hypothetical protein
VSTPVVFDHHLLVQQATGQVKIIAPPGARWNNPPPTSRPGRSKVLLWDRKTDGKLPR